MIKRLFIVSVFLCSILKLTAQYGNEWINFSQKHYRINIPKTGLYRIDSLTLANSGIPVSTINPKNFQLYIKGQEQYIYINGEADGVLNTNDYIEFYAEKNDCVFDSLAYDNILRIPNKYQALFNDTNYAFITWNSSVSNKRVSTEVDVSFGGYTAANYFYSEKIYTPNTYYSRGEIFLSTATDARYVTGEGFGTYISQGQTATTGFGNINVYPSSSLPAYIKTSYSGASKDGVSGLSYDHHLVFDFYDNTSSYSTLDDSYFFGFGQFLIEKTITADRLQNSSAVRVTSINDAALSSIINATNVHYISLKYPEKPDFLSTSEKLFYVDDDGSFPKTFFDINNVAIGGSSVILYDLTNHKYITTVSGGTNVKALIPNSGNQKTCFLTTTANLNFVTSLAAVNQTGYFNDYMTSNPDSAFLIVSHKGLQSSVNDYKAYRQSASGGSNHVIVGYIDELYDQFAYGNKKNPLAIKNFCKYLTDKLVVPPKYLLLIGKSIKNELVRTTTTYWDANELPTMGTPSSDNLLTTGLAGSNSATPFIPVGRISAKTNLQVTDYLNKVKTHEAKLPDHEEWRKRILHFAGGNDLYQQTLFQSYLQTYSVTICDTLYGGRVFSFYKKSSAPIQITVSDSVKELIDYGVSLISFFGHASISGFDQAIDDPKIYNNKDKYPFFIANSCYSGDIHTYESNSTSEAFTLIADKGSIGFLASSSQGLSSYLYNFSNELYHSIAYETYYKGVGDAIKNAALKNSASHFQLLDMTSLEMTLEGDPSIQLNAFKKPDYEIQNSYITFNTSTYVDSIGVKIKIKNLGKAIKDTFVVRVERYFATGDSVTFLKKIRAPYNSDTLNFFILKDYDKGIGLNKFRVFIDSYNEIAELSEFNNSTTGFVNLFISGGDAVPIYPYKYAIIPNTPEVTLKASTADPFAPTTNYKLELDTNGLFTHPINSTIISSSGGVIEWNVNLPFADSTVYFWRVSKDSVLPTDKFNWRLSSFQVIGTKRGWAQAHFHQFKNDSYQFVKYKEATRSFIFENDVKSLECNDGISVSFDQINYKVNASLEDYYSCAPNGWSFAVFDSISVKALETYVASPPSAGAYNNCVCVNYPLKAISFGTTNSCGFASWQTDMENFLNSIPVNSKVLAWSVLDHQSESYNPSLYNAFESIGSANIRTIKDTVPYIIFGKKGGLIGSAHEVVGLNSYTPIQLKDTLKTRWSNGYIASEIIGPSTKWHSLHWKQYSVELPTKDSVVLKVVGIKSNGIRDTLVSFPIDSTDVYDLVNYIDASVYPQMQLVARMKDGVYITPAQLKKWQVIYDEVPECALNAKKGFKINNDTLQEGDAITVELPIENVGVLPFNDSLLVTYWIENADGISTPLPQKLKMKPFVPTQVIIDTTVFNSYQYPGQNYLWIEVNMLTSPKYQLEQYHFNNVGRIPFLVNRDKANPLLDVTFDGTHILNGDIISAKPYILMTVKDENKFLALNDTTQFAVFIRYPNQSSETRLYFNKHLEFTPAQLPSNSCKIEWKPEFAVDGKYTLIVQAADRSKNVSGANDYTIQFEVINKQTVTEVLNYPNPFSTATKFVFTLTGSEVPDIFTIQIMTITGKVVREINKHELGNIHIGRNITDYAWDGRDDYGDKLGNGVYLYRVISRLNGQGIEKNQTEADSYFKKGVGKMVLMR